MSPRGVKRDSASLVSGNNEPKKPQQHPSPRFGRRTIIVLLVWLFGLVSIVLFRSGKFGGSISYLSGRDLSSSSLTERQRRLISDIEQSVGNKETSFEHGDRFFQAVRSGDHFFFGWFMRISGRYREGSMRLAMDHNVPESGHGSVRIPSLSLMMAAVREACGSDAITRDFDVFISMGDRHLFYEPLKSFVEKHIVFLSSSEHEDTELKNAVIIPDFYVLDDRHFFRGLTNLKKEAPGKPFLSRQPRAVFKGATTGQEVNTVENLHYVPRIIAGFVAQRRPDLMSFGFTQYVQGKNADWYDVMMRIFGPEVKGEPERAWLAYRYWLVPDGNAASWGRFESSMHSGSVPLVQSRFRKFWTTLLVHAENCMRVHNDMSNLEETVEYLNAYPEVAQKIAANAQALAHDVLEKDYILYYMRQTIQIATTALRS